MTRTPVAEEDRERLRAHVSSMHPGAHLEFDEEGYDHTMVIVEGMRAYRFPRADEYRNRVEIEARFLLEFAPVSPLPVPLPEYRDTPVPHSVYDFLPGAQFEREAFDACDATQRTRAAEDLARFLSVLHSFPLDHARTLGVQSETWWAGDLDHDGVARSALSLLDAETQERAEHVLDTGALVLRSLTNHVVLHNDLAGEHILHDGERITGVIDFGDLGIGDPALDFRFSREFGNDFARAVLQNYEGPRDPALETRLGIYNVVSPLRWLRRATDRGDSDDAQANRNRLADALRTIQI